MASTLFDASVKRLTLSGSLTLAFHYRPSHSLGTLTGTKSQDSIVPFAAMSFMVNQSPQMHGCFSTLSLSVQICIKRCLLGLELDELTAFAV